MEVMEIVSSVKQWLGQLGDIHVVKIGQTVLTLDNVLIGVFMLIFSFRIARILTKLLERKLAERLVGNPRAYAVYHKLIYYSLSVMSILVSLSVAGIPLSVFTVLGGALAIGVGFGSQNVVNNFISGLILLFEKPINIGDFVEIDHVSGQVVSIGGRSTRVSSIDDKIHVIPNSFFLEKNFLNWTLNNTVVRTEVKVGVAYGSDPVLIKQLLMQVLKNEKRILTSQTPQVLFEDFADSALVFVMRFWVDMSQSGPLSELRSDIRFAISAIFKQHQIDIPFVQRELHLNTQQPLQVQIQSDGRDS